MTEQWTVLFLLWCGCALGTWLWLLGWPRWRQYNAAGDAVLVLLGPFGLGSLVLMLLVQHVIELLGWLGEHLWVRH